MNELEITKIVGAVCGSLLAFLAISTVSHMLFDTHSDVVAFSVEVEGDAPAEEPTEAEPVDVAMLVAGADPADGERVFRKCAACHKVDGSDGVGPHLNGVVNREAHSVAGFNYSGALPDGAWTVENLYAFLESPKDYAPGTSMSFAGLDKSEDRAAVIAYLEATQ
jgi:cytochrome c